MYYIIDESLALRSWWLVPYAVYIKGELHANGITKEQYDLLSLCDGEHDIEDNDTLQELLKEKAIHRIEKGEKHLTEWQKPLNCDNRYMPSINWMITGKCNYNCLHCFNAKDNAPLQSEWSLEEANKLLDEAKMCGINGFTITGGEPMAHRNFLEIIDGIYARGMYVFELNTNGFFLNQNVLNHFKKIGCRPLMKISFDGIGYHDWMRNHKGAEEDAIRAIKLCIANDFPVKVQMNINRRNKDSILKSLEYLDSIGVNSTRVICTTDSVRWAENAHGQSFSVKEYYDAAIEITEEYTKKNHNMNLVFWQTIKVYPQSKSYTLVPLEGLLSNYRESRPLCQGNRGMLAIGANGNVYPCLQMSGWLDAKGIRFENVKETGLQKILQDSSILKEICTNIGDLLKVNEKCKNCKHLKYCRGGCRALALLTSDGDFLGSDIWKCAFFSNGYIDRFTMALNGYHNNTELKDEI